MSLHVKTARLVQDNLPQFRGHAALYRLSEPLDGHIYVIVSAVDAIFTGSETLIFPASANGKTKSFSDLEGSYRGGLDHAQALRNAGYELAEEATA